MTKSKFTEDLIYSQVFTFDVLSYFDSIATDENFDWIEKYFNVLIKDENNSAEKFNIHHIRPCCSFKDNEHKNRKQTQKLGDDFNGNVIKLSVYNHLFAHYYLWKIFNNKDLKESFQRMCGQQQYIDTLTENELKNIARLKEDCAKKNQTEEEKLEYRKNYRESNQEKRKEYAKIYHENNKEKESKYHKEQYENNKEKILKKIKEYRKNNKEKISKTSKEWYKNNKDRKIKATKRMEY